MGWISKFLDMGDDKVQVVRVKKELLDEVKETIKADLEDVCEHFQGEINAIKNTLEILNTRVGVHDAEMQSARACKGREIRDNSVRSEEMKDSLEKQINDLEDAMGKFVQTSHSILYGEMQQVKQHVHNACAQLSHLIHEKDREKSMP